MKISIRNKTLAPKSAIYPEIFPFIPQVLHLWDVFGSVYKDGKLNEKRYLTWEKKEPYQE